MLTEKDKITKQLNQTDPSVSEWTKIGQDGFDFALEAKKRFKNSGSDDKKLIVRTVGSNQLKASS